MRIALNAQLLSRTQTFRSGGISRVIYHLLAELARDPRGQTFDVFVPEAPADPRLQGDGTLRYHPSGPVTARPALRIAWEQALLPRRLGQIQPDLLHGLAYALPAAWPGPTIVTIYDLSFLHFPHAFNTPNRIYLTAATRAAVRRARRVLTISEHARRDIVRLLRVPEAHIDVTYPAAEERFRPLAAAQIQAFRQAHQLPETFIFAAGTLEPRKNLVGLLAAYARLGKPRPPLYIGGATGWRFSPIFDTVRRLDLAGDVQWLGFVPEHELALWYNAARLFVFPSLYEGFGLPVLEAMACGVPVITSDAASLPEVVGQAGIQVPATDTERLALEMQRVLDDRQLRAELRTAGRIQATRFSWRTLADQTVASYARAVAS